MDQHRIDRKTDSEKLRDAYDEVIRALGVVSKVLRTSSIKGYFGWVGPQKSAVTGIKVLIQKLRDDVPRY
jgi:hypothetical protein